MHDHRTEMVLLIIKLNTHALLINRKVNKKKEGRKLCFVLSQKMMACKYWSNYFKFTGTSSQTKYFMHNILCLLMKKHHSLEVSAQDSVGHYHLLVRALLLIDTEPKYRNWRVGAGVWSRGRKTSQEWSAKERMLLITLTSSRAIFFLAGRWHVYWLIKHVIMSPYHIPHH